jgi:hypothetical protein
MHIAPMLVHLSLASHSGHHEHYSPFQSPLCKRWDTPVFTLQHFPPQTVAEIVADMPFV